ncbi:hypothetical protein C2G38_2163391 [Gigaspora rosea]|uniref:Uncharacterized protein n=1 Tax=Gigaspora rosea TaxID=44941 RepID=A0A397VWW8_9GLOM|nr:hypothetical protein C2G38_2163391 [Gigaspora rosea]
MVEIQESESIFSSRTFIHDYPNKSTIEARYNSNGRTYCTHYNILSLGVYPLTPKLTQKSRNNTPQYPIPDSYIVETEVSERSLKCETKYISNSKVHYTITWKEGRAEWSVSSTKSSTAVVNTFLQKINQKLSTKLSGPRLFGFDIEPLYYARLQIGSQPVTTIKNNKRKKPLEDITSRSQQYKRLNSFGKDLQKAIDELIIKHKLTNLFGESIVNIHHIELDYKENQTCIKFKDSNFTTQTRLDAIVRVCDEALLGHYGYRSLAAVVPTLFHEYLIADRRNKINELMNIQINIEIFNLDKEINDQFSIDSSEYTSDILVDNSEIGNGAFRSLSAILKALIPVWKTGKNPVIIPGDTLFIKLGGDGKENYEVLAKVGKLFASQLADLKENGIIDNDGIYWSIEFYFSGDWRFTYLIMGQNAPNSEYFCLFCEYNAKSRYNMDLAWPPTGNTKALFSVIDLLNYIPDELHLLLRILDVLMECLFKDLFKKNDFERNLKGRIEKKMSDLNIHFKFYYNSARSNWSWTSLIGPNKKKLLQHFPVSEFISGICGINIENLCRKFYQLYELLRKPTHTEEEILKFEEDAKIGRDYHLDYSQQVVSKKNHNQVKLFFGGTTMGGCKKQKPVVYDILEFENRQIFYLINGTPTEITCKNINIS